MKNKLLTTFFTGLLTLGLSVLPVQADKICVAGNFDGNSKRASQVVSKCEKENADAILLMGDYSTRGISGQRNWKTNLSGTKKVLDEFGKSKLPVHVLSGSNDRLRDVESISNQHQNMVALKDCSRTKIADLNVVPLNGYNNQQYMFEGAKKISTPEMIDYLNTLNSCENCVAVSHVSPYGNIDKISKGFSVGDRSLEKVLKSKKIDSISSAIRESPGAWGDKDRWKINPGMNISIIDTDGKGNIGRVSFYE